VLAEIGELAFSARRAGEGAPSNQIWRCGTVAGSSLSNLTGLTVLGPDGFASLLNQPDPMVVSAQQITDTITLPISSATVSVPNAEVLQVSGDGDYQRDVDGARVFSVHFDYTVTLTLEPSGDPFRINDFLTPTLVHTDVDSASEGLLPWLINPVADLIIDAFSETIASEIQMSLSDQVNAAVMQMLKDQDAPQDTSVTLESVTLDPDNQQVLFTVWATVPETVLFGQCVSGVGAGGKRRPREQQGHLRAIRDALLLDNPEGVAYIETLANLSPVLVTLLRNDQALMRLVDDAVQRVLVDFPQTAPLEGALSEESAAVVRDTLRHLQHVGSPRIQLVAAALEPEVDRFVGKPAAPSSTANKTPRHPRFCRRRSFSSVVNVQPSNWSGKCSVRPAT
jgi:hypothetical protein